MADLKHLARLIFHETLAAVDIPAVMRRKVRVEGTVVHCGDLTVDLRAFSKIYVVAIGKAAFYRQLQMPQPLAYDYAQDVMAANAAAADAQEGMKAFLEKRPPKWCGR